MSDEAQGTVSGQASTGAPITEQNSAPLTKADLEGFAATFTEQLGKVERSLQKGTDKQIAQTRTEFAHQIKAVAEELGVSVRSLLAASGADDDTKRAVAAQLDEGSKAARNSVDSYSHNVSIIESVLERNGLTEDDLPHSVAHYAKHPDGDMFAEAVEKAKAKKPIAKAKDDNPLAKKVEELELELRKLKGEDVVPVGGTGVAGGKQQPLTVSALLKDKTLMAQWDNAVKAKTASRYVG